MPVGPKKLAADKFTVPIPAPREPLWKGPESTDKNGGITFSMLSRFLSCRERFRVKYVLGLAPVDKFSRVIEYGNMWHICEEALAAFPNGDRKFDYRSPPWEVPLDTYVETLCAKYPLQREEIGHWADLCRVQFPVYVAYWAKQPDVLGRTPLLQERSFNVPYTLPSGRVVRLRGKWDAVDLIGKGRDAGIYVQENKTKGDIDEQALIRQLTMDLQSMIYVVAISSPRETWHSGAGRDIPKWKYGTPVRGVRYNVVRRPLSGGRGTIVQRKGSKNVAPESRESYLDRLRGVIDGTGEDAPGPSHFFFRWKVEVTPSDVAKFRRQVLDPVLEQLCDWWNHVSQAKNPFDNNPGALAKLSRAGDGVHYRTPFGTGGAVDQYPDSDVDNYLDTGSEVGLRRKTALFEELN